MIAMALLAVGASDLRVIEVPSAQPISRLQVAVRAPADMTDREQAAWHAWLASMRDRNTRYTFTQIAEYGAQGGEPVRFEHSDELILIQLNAPRGEVELMGRLAYAILAQPRVTQAHLRASATTVSTAMDSDLQAAWAGYRGDAAGLSPDDVRRLWLRVVRPENVVFAVNPLGQPGEATKQIQGVFEKWPTGTSTPRSSPPRSLRFAGPQKTALTQWGWSTTTLHQSDSARVLALVALGTGKASSAHRIVREELGLSYLQSPFFLAGREGWRPRFVFGGAAPVPTDIARDALLKDVETWTPSTLARAISLADASLRSDYPLSPFILWPSGPQADSDATRLAWAAYGELTGSAKSIDEVLFGVNQVTVDQLKAAAKSLLETAIKL